ncbi:glycosyltransferase family 9 protein [Candidatus Photodesmus anomalopis]|uniref:ADP-heptose:LPS heptosyltransferase n=1 Tax=Candidatus Photodesmus katoptron Akat1 TaxID=1236703 RepID=S3DK19_9GAMM|nr:glycosyltransferase family 9 protein [Candidatus Photodesmus katoptron]EPE37494.1 ADP-heptose:LPS heptosyltransferase [Candidatus Photodesmus katoptron Akat1]
MSLFTKAPSSVCFLRLSSIGDVCHTVAVIQALQQYWPKTKVVWILGKIEFDLLDKLENVELIVFDKNSGLKGMWNVWRQLKGYYFDALIHMQIAIRSSILTIGIKAKYKIGFNFKRAKECQWLFTNKKNPDTKSKHVLDSFFSFIEYLGVPPSKPSWKLPINCMHHHYADNIIKNLPTIIICPSSSKEERNWLPNRYAKFADYVIKKGYQVVICGSNKRKERDLADEICLIMKYTALNLVGKTSLKQLTALLAKSELLLAPDSGPLHIATTQGTPVIGLYGHSNPERTGPYNSIKNVISVYKYFIEKQRGVLVDDLPWSTRVKGSSIMQSITLESVVLVFDAITRDKKLCLRSNLR